MALPRQSDQTQTKNYDEKFTTRVKAQINYWEMFRILSLIDRAAVMSQKFNSWQMHPLVIKIPTKGWRAKSIKTKLTTLKHGQFEFS